MASSQTVTESFAGVLITQGKYKFYSAALPIEALADTCFVTTRDEDPIKGFQRLLDEKKADAIAYYIDNEGGTIPTSVILSAQSESEFNYDARKKTIQFKSIPKAFLVLDGQHRVWGFRKAQTNLRVPVIIYAGLSRLEESRLFIDINTKQRPVPNELLLDIKKLADYESESELYLGTLFDLFEKQKNSAFKGAMSSSKRVKGQISRVTFNRALKPILPKIADNEPEDIFPVLNSYFEAINWRLAEKSLDKALISPILLGGFALLFPEVAVIVTDKYGKNGFTSDTFYEVTAPIFEKMKVATLKSPGKSAKAFYDILSKNLRDQKLRL